MFHGRLVAVGGGEKVIDIGGRKIVMVEFDGGVKVPFYLSTGKGGKADVPAGRWYPFFGFSKDGIYGWFIKKEGQANYYDEPRFRAAAKMLDEKFGDRRDKDDWGKKIKPHSQEHRDWINVINKVVNPKGYGLKEFYGKYEEVERLLIAPLRKKLKLKK